MKNKPLDEKDLQVIELLKVVFVSTFNNQTAAVKTNTLIAHLKYHHDITLHGRTIRRLLGDIRRTDVLAPGFIISNVDRGYWYSTDAEEQKTYIDQQLDRMANQFDNIKSLHGRLSIQPKSDYQLSLL